MKMRKASAGFTLIEVQLAVVILLMATAGMGALIMNDTRQLQWLETRQLLYSLVSADNKTAVYTEIKSAYATSYAVSRVEMTTMTVSDSSITATARVFVR